MKVLGVKGLYLRVAVVAVAVSAGGCAPNGSSQRNSSATNSGSAGANQAAPAATNEPPLKVNGEALTKEYKTDPAAADAKYKGKVLEVTGKVHDVYGKEVAGEPALIIWGYQEKPADIPTLVQCFFVKDQQEKMAGAKKGETVTVRGKCEGPLANIFVVLRGCEFLK